MTITEEFYQDITKVSNLWEDNKYRKLSEMINSQAIQNINWINSDLKFFVYINDYEYMPMFVYNEIMKTRVITATHLLLIKGDIRVLSFKNSDDDVPVRMMLKDMNENNKYPLGWLINKHKNCKDNYFAIKIKL